MDKPQLAWLEKELVASGSDWKIAYFHHPLYSSGGAHGSDLPLRAILEPLFVKYHVSMVLSGHDHFYERIKPQARHLLFRGWGDPPNNAREMPTAQASQKCVSIRTIPSYS